MLSIAPIASAAAAGAYFLEGPDADYYLEDGEGAGTWTGSGAACLGLQGAVDPEALMAVLEGVHPLTAKPLAQGGGKEHRHGWDCTFSAPKSVSVLAALASGRAAAAIRQAHQGAVGAALSLAEGRALVSRRGKAGSVHEKSAGLVCAMFTHETSRSLDPQLHSHCVVANLAPRVDGSYGAIESRALYQWKMALGAVYRAELSSRMQELGYSVERDKASFRIAGLPKEVEALFSTRRKQIEAALENRAERSARSAEVAALLTRDRKAAASQVELRVGWTAKLLEAGYSPEQLNELALRDRTKRSEIPPPEEKAVLRELTLSQSVFHPQDLYRVLATRAQIAQGGLRAVEAQCTGIRERPDVLRLLNARGESAYTTTEMRDLEARLVSSMVRGAQASRHALDVRTVGRALAASSLSPEQQAAAMHCCTGRDVAIVNGIAGSGKSAAAALVRDCYLQAGYSVVGAALSGKAANSLAASSGIPSQTLHSLLDDWSRMGGPPARTVLVLDEAAMIGSRLMARLHDWVERAGAKLILIGDTRQLQPIEAGGIYNALLQRMGCASLTNIRRQRQDWMIETVRDFAAGRAELALASFSNHGDFVTERDVQSLQRRLVEDWHAAARSERRAGQTLMLAATQMDTMALNRLAREAMRGAGALGTELLSETGVPWAVGDRLLFTRNSRLRRVRNGDLGTVRFLEQRTDGLHFIVDLDDGRVARFGKDYEHVRHGYAITVHKAQGATVDRAFVLLHEHMSDREWSYVAASRAREQTRLYGLERVQNDLACVMERSHRKGTSLEYEIEPHRDV